MDRLGHRVKKKYEDAHHVDRLRARGEAWVKVEGVRVRVEG